MNFTFFKSLLILFFFINIFIHTAKSGSFEPFVRWGYENPLQIKLNPAIRVCWAEGTELFSKLTQFTENVTRAKIPYPILKLFIESKVNREFSINRTGIHFVGWEDCNSGNPFDAMIFITIEDKGRFSGLSSVGELGGLVENAYEMRAAKFKSNIFSTVTIKVSHKRSEYYDPKQFGDFDNVFESLDHVLIHEFAHLAGLRHENERNDRYKDNENPFCNSYKDSEYSSYRLGGRTTTNYYATPYDRYSITNYCWVLPEAIFNPHYQDFFTTEEAQKIEDQSVLKLTNKGYKRTYGLSAGDVKTLSCFYKNFPTEWESTCPNFNRTYRETRTENPKPKDLSVIDCTANKRPNSLGTRCKTSKNFIFEKVKDGWKDIQNGKIWFEEKYDGFNHHDAIIKCNNLNRTLPTGWPESLNGKLGFPNYDSDFVVAEKHGVREALGTMYGLHWSSSVNPVYDTQAAYVFYGYLGNIFLHDSGVVKDGFYCVSR